jgi:hypothetical protein
MDEKRISRGSASAMIVLSLVALACVVSGYFQEPQADEGRAAHIFQLSVAALFPVILLFLSTADWKKPMQSLRPVVLLPRPR